MTSLERYLLQFFKNALRHYKAIIVSLIVVIAASVTYSCNTTPMYFSNASFFLASNKSQGSSLGGYASLLGLGGLGGKSGEAMIVDILRSRRIKQHIATVFRPQFEKEIQAKISKSPMNEQQKNDFVVQKLKLRKNLSFDYVPSRFTILISYKNADPKLANEVLIAYLDYLNTINQELELSAEKELIKILDKPSAPRFPSTPNLKRNLVRSIALLVLIWGFILGYSVLRVPFIIREEK